MDRSSITQARVRELLSYDPETGHFRWLGRGHGKRFREDRLNFRAKPNTYLRIKIDGVTCSAHRLVWLYVHGHWPTHDIDHVNGNPSDNRLCNLRDATPSQNIANANFSKNASGRRGVHRGPNGRWRAQINVAGTRIHLGVFDELDMASAAYRTAAAKYFGEFAIAARPSHPGGA